MSARLRTTKYNQWFLHISYTALTNLHHCPTNYTGGINAQQILIYLDVKAENKDRLDFPAAIVWPVYSTVITFKSPFTLPRHCYWGSLVLPFLIFNCFLSWNLFKFTAHIVCLQVLKIAAGSRVGVKNKCTSVRCSWINTPKKRLCLNTGIYFEHLMRHDALLGYYSYQRQTSLVCVINTLFWNPKHLSKCVWYSCSQTLKLLIANRYVV